VAVEDAPVIGHRADGFGKAAHADIETREEGQYQKGSPAQTQPT